MRREPLLRRRLTILDAIDDPNIFAHAFQNAGSWSSWRTFLACLFGLPLSEEQRELFNQCTGRQKPPEDECSEAWLVIGRRGGKSFTLALIAVFLASFRDWRPYLGPGERATVMIIAADRKQARVCMRYVNGLLHSVPMLLRTVIGKTMDRIDLTNRVTIEVHSASYRTTRGYTLVAALCDEIAFLPHDEGSGEPDYEIINAIRPGMATIPGAMLLCASSPYARRGALWDAWKKYYGKDGPTLVWQAPTRVMNPSVPQSIIDQAMDEDPASAQAEYLAQFRTDIEAFVSREAVLACVDPNTRERPPMPGTKYQAFVDPSGGSSDSMTLAIGHRHGEKGRDKSNDLAVVDCIREIKPPFSPQAVVIEFADLLKSYRVTKIEGDRYGGEWPREQFRQQGIQYELAPKPKSAIYQAMLPVLNSRRADLLDHPRLISQLCSLERRTARGGRDSIDHAPGSHDDVANSVAGLLTMLTQKRGYDASMSWIHGVDIGDGKSQGKNQGKDQPLVAHFDNEYQRRERNLYIASGGYTKPY
jgi:hypothetical protein